MPSVTMPAKPRLPKNRSMVFLYMYTLYIHMRYYFVFIFFYFYTPYSFLPKKKSQILNTKMEDTEWNDILRQKGIIPPRDETSQSTTPIYIRTRTKQIHEPNDDHDTIDNTSDSDDIDDIDDMDDAELFRKIR